MQQQKLFFTFLSEIFRFKLYKRPAAATTERFS